MESQEFIVLYTHQKMKKSKVWQDGILKITPYLGNKAILYDDKGGCLESLFLKCLEVKPGDDLESDRYLITVEEVKVAGSTAVKQDVIKKAPALNSKRFMSSGRSLGCQPAGLKRKFTGFQGPRQVPKKTVITEKSEPAASLESEKPGPVFLSPLYSTPPLFSTTGKKDTSNMPTDSENTVTYKNRERNGTPFSSVISTPSFKINPEVLCEENYVCSPVTSVNKHSDSLLTDESMKRDSLVSHSLGVSQNIRSKAQILALLKSTSTSTSKELNSEIIGHFPQIQPQGSLEIPTESNCLIEHEEYAEVKNTESLHNQYQSENPMRNTSRWAMYLSSQSSPVHSSTVDGKDIEKKPKTQEGNLNLKDLSMQKRIQFFETCAEKGKRYNEDKPIDDNDQSWDQEGKLKIPSFYENSSLPMNCSIVVNDGLLLDSDIQKNNKRSVDQNDQIGKNKSILLREKAQEININGTPEKKYEHLQIESSLSNNSGISDDIFSKSSTNNESLSSIHEPMSDISQPLMEVTFNLNNFETSDSEEESQESSKIFQDSEDSTLVNSSNSRCENISCKEVGSEHLPLLTSIGGKLSETFPMKEILLSQFCDKTCVGYDTETWKAGNTGEEVKEVCSDTLSNFDSSLEWTDDRYVENDEGANKSISASFPSKSESMNTNLHIPHFLNIASDQKPENNLFSEQAQTRPFIMGSDLDKNTNRVLPLTSSSGNSIQLLNAKQIHSKECIALDKSQTQASNSFCYPLGKTHISKDTESHISESEEVGRSRSLSQDHIDVETSGESKQYWNNLRNSSEISGLVNSISLLKSLTEHSTALEGLEVLKKKNISFKQQGTLQTYEPDSSPEAGKPLTTVVSQAIPKSPHLNQDPHQMIKTNEAEPSESLQSLQSFPSGSEEETAFLAVIPKQMERETCKDPKPVEFQGHQVKGSATSAVMVRGHSSEVERGQLLDSTVYESCTTNMRFLTPELPSTCMQTDFLQVTSPEQKISTLSPVSPLSFNSRDDEFMLEFSEESLKAQTLPGNLHFLNVDICSHMVLICSCKMKFFI
uniref:Zinc finger GRF-type containing 1 n=1 Tax=Moschus moschiferus TaxID=68415 RepID=A0A8C6G211_MOSMO